ncbi:MAG TPA: hypothetical protein VLW75_01015, partial [Rhizomicrobium sp.]|nr:hypothetical protein [Rhizomicrobium sp.]
EIFDPLFLSASPFDAVSHLGYEKTRPDIWEKGASIAFQPEDSDWVLSASIRYGQTGRSKELQHITTVPYSEFYGIEKVYRAFQDFKTHSSERHTILDFKAGRDVGIGRFGSGATSVVSLGVRFAQFKSANHAGIMSQPSNCASYCHYNRFYASFDGKRKFEGIGPALSWNASAMIAGNQGDGGIGLDWGVNGALLFGRQRATAHYQTTEHHFIGSQFFTTPYQNTSPPISRSKRVTVTNLGGFAGITWRYAAAKVTLGYRADYFFGVLDGGIDAAKKEDRSFYGPFAAISVGIGD